MRLAMFRSTGNDVMIQLVMAFVLNRIDYCNAVLAGLPRTAIEPLQHAQNAAARLVFGLRSSDHITRALTLLHWLPVRFHIKFKLCLLMHQIHVGRCLSYLAALVSSSVDNCCRPHHHHQLSLMTKMVNVPFLSAVQQSGTVSQVNFK